MDREKIEQLMKLKQLCDEFVDNIDGWIETDDKDMINTATVNLKEAIPQVMDEL